ncbi:hypothetical protein L1049_001532 [Liquidambar formosana]|uniref:Ninja-family protein n=1 Tax=Liquidambar formosana TaxID=63359 RepID=A0AAP0NEF2_LIQFO
MDDENGLELSLGLSCGGSSVKSKGKNGSSSDTRIDEGDKGSKMDDFKNFLHAGIQKQDSATGSQRNDPVKSQENFFNNLSKAAVDVDASMNLNGRGLWVANANRSAEVEEEKRSEVGKRKPLFEETNHQKKHEREAHHADLHDKAKTSHISITTEDGSTAENEDVAESEVEGSISRLVPHHEEGNKRYTGVGGSSEVSREAHAYADSSVMELQGQKTFNIPSENEFKIGNLTYGVPYALQPLNIMNASYPLPVKESNSVVAPVTSGYPLPSMMQMMPPANSERPGVHLVNSGNMPMAFGYSPVQLPMLDKEHSWGFVSHPQQLHPSYAGRATGGVAPTSEKHNNGLKLSQVAMQVPPPNSSEALLYDGRASELTKGDGKQHAVEEGSSSQTEDDVKGNNMIFKSKDASDQPTSEVFPYESLAIRPGITPGLKFGGCGSYPNLPWVSTTGRGPNGRTISGVPYNYNGNQIRIVCACHGSHMSPEEFVRHASEEHAANPDAGNGLASFPNSNPAASAQS